MKPATPEVLSTRAEERDPAATTDDDARREKRLFLEQLTSHLTLSELEAVIDRARELVGPRFRTGGAS